MASLPPQNPCLRDAVEGNESGGRYGGKAIVAPFDETTSSQPPKRAETFATSMGSSARDAGNANSSRPAGGNNAPATGGGDDDESEAPWYKSPDGSFFMERRTPFFRFNFFAYACALGFFLYMCYSITVAFIEQNDSPPTTSKVRVDLEQNFPLLMLCNFEEDLPMLPIKALARNDYIETDVTDSFKPLVCGSYVTDCLMLDVELPAFASVGTGSDKVCGSRNLITVVADVDAAHYTEKPLRGAWGYLSQRGPEAEITERLCSGLFLESRCSTLATVDEGCTEEVGTLAFDEFAASAGIGSLVTLSTETSQFSPDCEVTYTTWNPKVTSLPFVEDVVASYFSNLTDIPGYTYDPNSIILMTMEFTKPRVKETTYNRVSGSAYFGSLAGWLGACSDGWGIISILFIVERLSLFLNERRRG